MVVSEPRHDGLTLVLQHDAKAFDITNMSKTSCDLACAQDKQRSRIGHRHRFHIDFHESFPELATVRLSHSQWVILSRPHAAIVTADIEVIAHFERHCYQTHLR